MSGNNPVACPGKDGFAFCDYCTKWPSAIFHILPCSFYCKFKIFLSLILKPHYRQM